MGVAKFRSKDPYLSGNLRAKIARVICLLADESPADLWENMRPTILRRDPHHVLRRVLRRDLQRGLCRDLHHVLRRDVHGVRNRKTVAARRYNKSRLSIGE